MTPEDAAALDLFLTEARTVREIAAKFRVSKVTVGFWIKLLPLEIGQRRQGKCGPLSKTYKIKRAQGSK